MCDSFYFGCLKIEGQRDSYTPGDRSHGRMVTRTTTVCCMDMQAAFPSTRRTILAFSGGFFVPYVTANVKLLSWSLHASTVRTLVMATTVCRSLQLFTFPGNPLNSYHSFVKHNLSQIRTAVWV